MTSEDLDRRFGQKCRKGNTILYGTTSLVTPKKIWRCRGTNYRHRPSPQGGYLLYYARAPTTTLAAAPTATRRGVVTDPSLNFRVVCALLMCHLLMSLYKILSTKCTHDILCIFDTWHVLIHLYLLNFCVSMYYIR